MEFLGDSQSLVVLLLLATSLVSIVASLFWFRKPRVAHLPYPPGPLSLPIIGSFYLLRRLPHRSLQHLSKIHGPLMFLRLGSLPAVVVSTAAMARELFKTHDANFSSRTRLTAAVILFDCADIGLAPFGPYWRLMRLICVKELFTNKTLERFSPIRAEEVALLMRAILEDSKMRKPVPVASRLLSAANNIISRMTLGQRFSEMMADSSHDNPSENIVKIIKEMMELIMVFNVGDFIPYLQWMDIQGYVPRLKLTARKAKAVFQKVIDSRREELKLEPRSPSQLLDVLLNISKENHGDVSITDDNITAVLMEMFAGGTETCSVTVEWALAELLRNPIALTKVQKELDSVVGHGRLAQESDFQQLPYFKAVVKETLRLHPPFPLVGRESIEPCQVAGYYVPAKSTAIINVWAIGRDDSVWMRPSEFWPERFLGNNSVDLQGDHYELLPFGTGRRSCPGWKLGLKNVELMLANLVHCFQWSLPPLKTELDMLEKFSTVMAMASPLHAMAAPRWSEDLYGGPPI